MTITCRTCGAKFPESEKRCPYCGNYVDPTEVDSPILIEKDDYIDRESPTNNTDSASGGLNVLSVFFPIVGWILSLALKSRYPRKAKFCKLWAWIGFGIWCMISLWSWIITSL